MLDSEFIRQAALEAGFSLCGTARVRPLGKEAEFFDAWIAAGFDSSLGYMKRNREKRFDPAVLVAGARSVVVCAVNYKNGAWMQDPSPEVPKIASYMYARDYHCSIIRMLGEVFARIRERYPSVGGRAFCDTAPIHEKSWAVEAGLGWTGRNSLLVTPEYGSFVLLGELVLDAECDDYDRPYCGEGCGECFRCMESCPTKAIATPHVVDTGRCISRLTIEKLPDGVAASRETLHGWLAGCDMCQSCCPYNAKAPLSSDPVFAPVVPPPTTREFWESLTEDKFDTLFGDTPLTRTGYAAIKSRL